MIARRCLLLGLLLAVGCVKPTPNPPVPGGGGGTTKGTGGTISTAAPTTDVAGFAKQFLLSVHEGKATAANLSVPFKRIIAEPVFDADKSVGYSDSAAENWLKSFQGKLANPTLSTTSGEGDVLMFTGSVPGEKPTSLTLRVVKDAGNWVVDWFFPAEVGPATVPTLNAQSFAAAAFLEGLFGRKDVMASGMIALDAKKRLAPAFGSDKRPFNPGTLQGKLAEYRGGFTGYTITKVENDTVTGEAIKGEAKKPFTVKLVKGERPFEWQVDSFQVN